jgi:N-glycosylase/DNA lyase
MLRSPTLWEDAAKTLFTTNCSWSLTKKMCAALCSERFVPSTPSGTHPFPPPQPIAACPPEKLKDIAPVGYRAAYVKALADRFITDPYLHNLESDGLDYRSADNIVRDLLGFADYACAHLLVLAGYFDKIPIDTTVVSFLKENYRVRKPHSFVARHYRKWGSDRWWGYKLDRMNTNQHWIGD